LKIRCQEKMLTEHNSTK